MARKRSYNPLAFLGPQVTVISSVVYIALFVVLLINHETVPTPPSNPTPIDGINLTQAWLDLEVLSNGYHPWGSRRNEKIREYLLQRIEQILDTNNASTRTVHSIDGGFTSKSHGTHDVTVFANDTSNFTALDGWTKKPWTLYGESSNILVYIRGQEDEAGDWWNSTKRYSGQSGVLLNAHYDSVSSGLGATDDGVGVVSILQLISYYTYKGKAAPKRGLVALFNNGEENGLYGAHNYVRHPVSQLPHTFLNLEGAGAGGRATLFRSTDAEVTSAYAKSPLPFGTVISGDGFKRGFIRSGTDYTVFTEELGLRGLDVAFFRPRARYHTDQDDARNAGPNSLWHMLSATIATVDGLTSYQSKEFEGLPDDTGKLSTGKGSNGVWFDLLGQTFAVFRLNTLFALSISLLTAGPIVFILLEVLIRKSNKWYPFAGRRYLHSSDDDDAVRLHGRRGFCRFLLAFVVATAVTVLLAYLVTKMNPYIVYSSEYAVWAMDLSAWFALMWFFLKGAASIRPTALHRMFVLIWLYVLTWILLVFATVGENNLHLASGYFVVIYNASALLALLISYLELFALPTTRKYVEHALGAQADTNSTRPGSRASRQLLDQQDEVISEAEPSERTSLLQNATSRSSQHTFTSFGRRRADRDEVPEETDDPFLNKAYLDEQAWSSSLPQWTWALQFLILAPINVIIVGQIALLLTHAINQTPADGNAVLPIYLLIAVFGILLLLPLTPFLHRLSFHIPTFMFFVLAGTLLYNLMAFPFSRDARMKYYFVQQVNLSSGVNNVSLIGLDGYIQDIVQEMPSASDQPLYCGDSSSSDTSSPTRNGLTSCSWHGLAPKVIPKGYTGLSANRTRWPTYSDWIDFNSTHGGNTASIQLQGMNTKICNIKFDHAVSGLKIEGSSSDPRQKAVPEGGSREVHLFSRTFDKTFSVNVTWEDGSAKGQTGRVSCMWDDANMPGIIPAFDELRRNEPVWSAVTKTADGLVEGFKDFRI
ncbi:hypothetical protein DOTSEDRAFT_68948 [Dothistroma septosporum NZE10]|uniref:Peptide hydrolase n=1 Tax=Dothistroma septosporum (strain NZE10 / CBS 128990) TaxID=675120 RepID=N1Q4H5_DOTSN|nr:hypothetical protein DOTSEDRAFT_68948 [Dothistroma septosporum NZE10]